MMLNERRVYESKWVLGQIMVSVNRSQRVRVRKSERVKNMSSELYGTHYGCDKEGTPGTFTGWQGVYVGDTTN